MAFLCNDVLSLSIHSFFGVFLFTAFSFKRRINTRIVVNQYFTHNYVLPNQMHTCVRFGDG